jgi:hypothetical protein
MSEYAGAERPQAAADPAAIQGEIDALRHSGLSRGSRSQVLEAGGGRGRHDRSAPGPHPSRQTKAVGAVGAPGGDGKARTLRGPGAGVVLDGPFAETKEQLLGLYVVDCADEDAAIAVARELRQVNPSAVYEIRAIQTYIPGAAIPMTDAVGPG